ncbi:MAG: helix-turn-helix protein [Firmicutes bacterium]|nr:helix-turn-helix protein [Bacillota bacterium]
MKVWNLKPNQYLRQYISRYWLWEDEQELPKLLPGTGTELIFHYHKPPVLLTPSGEKTLLPCCHIISPRYGFYPLKPTNRIGFIAVRFRAGAFRHFCNEASNDLIDSFIDIKTLWGRKGFEFEQLIIEARTLEERIRIIEIFLMGFLEKYHRSEHWVDLAVKNLLYQYNTIKLKDISHELFISDRQFQRKLKESVGVSPKTFQRIARFESVLKNLLLRKNKHYLDLALENGYYDQSHFIKEFRNNVGEYPSAFLKDENFMSHFYNEKLTD